LGDNIKNFLDFILQIYLFFKRPNCSKLNADSGNVIKNGLFYYLAAHFIDLNMQKYAFA